MKDNPDSDRILNADHPEDYRLLKKVLNILFLTIGVVLFLAVIVVVIYAFAGKYRFIRYLSKQYFLSVLSLVLLT